MRPPLAIAVLSTSLALFACGGNEGNESAGQAGSSVSEEQSDRHAKGERASSGQTEAIDRASEPGVTIATADSQFGQVLFDGDDRAIYFFDKERSGRSECYGGCATAWPPVVTDGKPQAAAGAQTKLLGTVERDDGSTQVTYDGRPLYYYVDDPRGQLLCHGVEEFGGVWLAVQPDGAAVQ